jgi:hypothetical protein
MPQYDIYGNQRILDGNNDGSAIVDIGANEYDMGTSVDDNNQLPEMFALYQNYPNPFNPATTIKYSLPHVGTGHAPSVQIVKLVIYDVLGKEVATLVNEQQRPGSYKINFNASELSSGIYLYKLTAGSFTQSRKMIILR